MTKRRFQGAGYRGQAFGGWCILWLIFVIGVLIPVRSFAQDDNDLRVRLGDTVIDRDTTWAGVVDIHGVVVVGRRAVLTIEPGTVIRFWYVDVNHDGIGDGEIRVLGGLLAQGTAQNPIVFKSAEVNPAPKELYDQDRMRWSYVLIFTSGQKNIVQYCQFHDAFSGLQVHFSTVKVDNCLFSKNNEGLRFGRAKLIVKHNVFRQNHIGIRFTRMEGPVEIKFNEISHNDVGVFLVPSGQNILDFFDPGHTGKPWNEGHLAIYKNNIFGNRDYNLKLGAKQKWDLEISDNWWGRVQREGIMAGIFDKRLDPELGRAVIRPVAKGEISAAGIVNAP